MLYLCQFCMFLGYQSSEFLQYMHSVIGTAAACHDMELHTRPICVVGKFHRKDIYTNYQIYFSILGIFSR